jgi:hypothetical protein
LGCNSSQRAESLYPLLKGRLNPQLGLDEATRRLAAELKTRLRKLTLLESENGKKLPRTLDLKAFSYLIDTVTIYAISKLSVE